MEHAFPLKNSEARLAYLSREQTRAARLLDYSERHARQAARNLEAERTPQTVAAVANTTNAVADARAALEAVTARQEEQAALVADSKKAVSEGAARG